MGTLRLLPALYAQHGFSIYEIDFLRPFLNPTINKDHITITIPHGIADIVPDSPAYSILLKARYGLKQDPRLRDPHLHHEPTSQLPKASHDDNLGIAESVVGVLYINDTPLFI